MIEAPSSLPTADARLPRGQALRRGLGANPLLVAGAMMSALIRGERLFLAMSSVYSLFGRIYNIAASLRKHVHQQSENSN